MPSVLTRAGTAVCLGALVAVLAPAAAWAHDPEPPRVKAPSTATSGVTATQAKLSAIVDPRESASTVHFEIGRATSYGFTSQEKAIRSESSVQAWISVYGLAPLTTYHFRAVAKNVSGVTSGPDQTFTTPAGTGTEPPEAITDVQPGTTPATSPLDASLGDGAAAGPLNTTPAAGPDPTPGAPTGTADGPGATGEAPVLVPEQAKSVVVEELSGAVNWRPPGAKDFQGMTGVGAIPVGAIVDARHGTVGLSADAGAGIDSGRFWGAVFEVRDVHRHTTVLVRAGHHLMVRDR